ncbi:MAG: hypothetical protein ACK40O_10920 [Allosphingosinicella sp.]
MILFHRTLLAAAAAAFLLAGCEDLDRRAMVMVPGEDYAPEILLSGEDGIVSPDGLLWRQGQLAIADEGGSAVRIWTPGGRVTTLATAEDGLQSPEDLAWPEDGILHFTDDDGGGLWWFKGGTASKRLPAAAPLEASEGLVLAPSDTLVVGAGETGALVFVSPGGGIERLDLGIAKAESLAFDGEGNLYIADNRDDVLYRLDRDGTLRRPIAGREGFSPESIHFAGSALLITDSRHGKLYRYAPEDGLSTIAVFAGELANVQGVTTDGAGNIYVSVQSDLEAGKGFVLRLRPKGRSAP